VLPNSGITTCSGLQWTADSRRLVYLTTASLTSNTTTIHSVNADGTGLRTLGTLNGTGCDLASADGQTAYLVTAVNGKSQLTAFDGGAGPRTVSADWPAGQQPAEVIAAAAGTTRLLVATEKVSSGCGCSTSERYAIVDTATGQVTTLDNANDKQGSAAMSGAFTTDGRVVLLADRNHRNGSGVIPFLTVFGPDGAILAEVPPPDVEYGQLAGFGG
jgi:hypothetical protein